MNYGTSVHEIKNELVDQMHRTDEDMIREMTFSGLNETYNPRGRLIESPDSKDKSNAAAKSILKQTDYENFRDGKSNGKTLNMHLSAPPDNHDDVHTSSEFVLVLYDDEKRNNQEKPMSFDLELDEAILPPPLSLSAPELGTLGTESPPTPQQLQQLRRCVSSTELLYEKAMARFYQAVEFEESENAKKRSASIEPVSLRSRLSSIGDNDRHLSDRCSLERTNSFKRKSIEKIGTGGIIKPPSKVEPLSTTKSENVDPKSKEADETEDERDLKKEILDSQKKLSLIRNLEPSSSIEYEDDYTDSTASSASLTSIDSLEKFKSTLLAMNKPTSTIKQTEGSELDTYHPVMEPQSESSRKIIESPLKAVYDTHMRREEFSNDADVSQSIDDEDLYDSEENSVKRYISPKPEPRALSPYRIPEPDQSTILLTKPLPSPSPDFVPKPILKTSSASDSVTESDAKEKAMPTKPTREKKKERKGIMQLFGGKKTSQSENVAPTPPTQEEVKPKTTEEKMTPAALAKKKSMEQRQSSMEENKVAVDHYSDIVKEMSVLIKPKVPLYMSSEELKKAAEKADEELRNVPISSSNDAIPKSLLETEKRDSFERPAVSRRSTSRESDSRSIFAIKLSKDTKKTGQREEIVRSQLSLETDAPTDKILDSKLTEMKPISTKDESNDAKDEKSRGRSSKATTIPTRSASKTRSRSSSALRSKTVQLKEPDDKLPVRTRTPSSTRNRSESKSPSVKSRTKLNQKNVQITRTLIKDPDSKPSTPTATPEPRSQTPEELMVEAEEKVKGTMNYITDLALFVVACWVYVFKDAWMAVPILGLMVGRQLGSTLQDKFPKWMKRKRD
ncbi:hypothetical protein HA402_011591 [Bradysia odoriphaga]|nr:hypothetical protein HA402_011591 [Bradysia odoriphaga]